MEKTGARTQRAANFLCQFISVRFWESVKFNITWKNNLKLLFALISVKILLKGLDYSLSVSISLHTAGAYEI